MGKLLRRKEGVKVIVWRLIMKDFFGFGEGEFEYGKPAEGFMSWQHIVMVSTFVIVGLVLAIIFYNLPIELEARTALMVLAFSPIGSAVPAFTEEMGGDAGLSAALNSISIICSIVFMVSILVIML